MVIVGIVLMLFGTGSFIVAFGVSLAAFRSLVDFQFEKHHETWVRDGRPVGGRVTRPELSFLSSDLAATLCFQRWVMRRPDWLEPASAGEAFRTRAARWFGASIICLAVGMIGIAVFGLDAS
jgi:hypothetical protein